MKKFNPAKFATQEEAYEAAQALVSHWNIPAKIWSPEDLDEALKAYPKKRREEIRKATVESREWVKYLTDLNDDDWAVLEDLTFGVAYDLGIQTKRAIKSARKEEQRAAAAVFDSIGTKEV